ncbi:TraR/DksA family transcriptional regulator [Salmonella enterica]|nr:TraR/DksA family transcriptional regulator [Salmonella enterica]EAX6601666.1 TraR/DksA family transcriptional regulator [Salmonella enterica]
MADEIDRDQEFNERQLEAAIARSRSSAKSQPSLYHCRQCGDEIPEKRRLLLPGVSLCIDCQMDNERQNR